MAISVFAAAKRLAEKSGWTLSNLELQKLVYLAHMLYMGRNGGAALVDGSFEAWDYGPVHPQLYHHLKVFGADPVEDLFHSAVDLDDGPETKILDEILDHLGQVGGGRLVAITHRPNGAWDRSYVPGARGVVIPNRYIMDEYTDRARSTGAS